MHRYRVVKTLLVEDDLTTRSLLKGLLEARGYEVSACADGESAWELYTRTAYPLVLLDLMLPGIDGLQLCRRMRGLPHGDRSIIVVLTGRNQPQDLQAVLDAGADDYLTKPVDAQRLAVRLTIAERQVDHLALRKDAEAKLADTLIQLQKSRDDVLAILNQLRIGSAITDEHGCVTFLNAACERLFGRDAEEVRGTPWEELWPADGDTKKHIRSMLSQPPEHRTKISTHLQAPGGRRYCVDIELKDHPCEPGRTIFLFYDMSEIYDLRRLLTEKAQFHHLVGKSELMLLVYQQIRDVAAVDATVLIEGETGTGKELVARAIHNASRRKDKPFIAVNCAGLTDSLLTSQLFGHKRGAFTGAVEDHKGVFEAAHGGTIFLDEIGDIPLNVQTALLRVLQEREIVRLGESTPRKIDVRVLVATHHNLTEDVAKGTFRSDLLYRIRVARIRLPALRARREDVPLLVGTFLGQCTAAAGKHVEGVSPEAMGILLAYEWPGNVR
ncbi:MAG TPA: sigma 54-interacting transcriptional regulator, partial [Burkholderiales bacterium]|nr:sigma 54-interacting transcriptional regulator [Burkholderiales bacterium]